MSKRGKPFSVETHLSYVDLGKRLRHPPEAFPALARTDGGKWPAALQTWPLGSRRDQTAKGTHPLGGEAARRRHRGERVSEGRTNCRELLEPAITVSPKSAFHCYARSHVRSCFFCAELLIPQKIELNEGELWIVLLKTPQISIPKWRARLTTWPEWAIQISYRLGRWATIKT